MKKYITPQLDSSFIKEQPVMVVETPHSDVDMDMEMEE